MNKWLALAGIALAGCAAGNAPKLLAEPRPAITDYTTVQVLTEIPQGATRIAELKATFDPRLEGKASADEALDELRRQAASVGANAVVLTSRDGIYVFDRVPVGTNVYRNTPSLVTILGAIAVWSEPGAAPAMP